MNKQYDDKVLLDYIEGELDASGRAEVEGWMKQDQPLALMVRQMISDRNELRELTDPTPPGEVMAQVDQQIERAILFGNYDGGNKKFKRNQRGAMGIIIGVGLLATLFGVVAMFVFIPAIEPPPPSRDGGKPVGPVVVAGPMFDPEQSKESMLTETQPPDFWVWPSHMKESWAAEFGRTSPWHMTSQEIQMLLGNAQSIQQQPELAALQQLKIVSLDPAATFAALDVASVAGQLPALSSEDKPIYFLFKFPKAHFHQSLKTLTQMPEHVRMSFGPRTPGVVPKPKPEPKVNPFEHWPKSPADYGALLLDLLPKKPAPVVPENIRTAIEILVVIEPVDDSEASVASHSRLRKALLGLLGQTDKPTSPK
jgi:hypothetical protein